MTWQIAIVLQVLIGACVAIVTRRLTLTVRSVFWSIGVLTCLAIAIIGCTFPLIFAHRLPILPSGLAWLYIITEGFCIPAAWLMQYKIYSVSGAGNSAVISTTNTVATAALGLLLLHDTVAPMFVVGVTFVLISLLVTAYISSPVANGVAIPLYHKLAFICCSAALYAAGSYAEKQAITHIGVWDYAVYGWAMQFVGALIMFLVFGRQELRLITRQILAKGLLLGAMTGMSGGLYIYALSKGALSHTAVAASGKVALTIVLAALFLRERDALSLRITAFVCSCAGLFFIIK